MDVDDMAVMQDAIDESGSHRLVAARSRVRGTDHVDRGRPLEVIEEGASAIGENTAVRFQAEWEGGSGTTGSA